MDVIYLLSRMHGKVLSAIITKVVSELKILLYKHMTIGTEYVNIWSIEIIPEHY